MACNCGKASFDHSQSKTAKQHLARPTILLKDYLTRDDLSSCSSSSFKSFPRRQCCTTVGLIDLEIQRKKSNKRNRNTIITLPRSTSALQRASEAVINVLKSLPLSQKKRTNASVSFLSRSFSKKLLRRSGRFWRREARKEGSEEEGGDSRRSFRELLLMERDNSNKTTSYEDAVLTAAPSSTATFCSGFGSNSWGGESEFTFSSSSVASSSESSAENDVVETINVGKQRGKMKMEEVPPTTARECPHEEKEQFSPVSVLDFPFEDDEEIMSHVNSASCSLLEGTKHKHEQKRRHIKSIASLEPMALEKRIALLEQEDVEPPNHSTKQNRCSLLVPITCPQNGCTNVRHENIDNNARNLLNFIKRSIPSNNLIIKAENLLFDYFKQGIGEINHTDNSKKLHLCKLAEEWINGQPQEMYLGWEVKEGREVYIKEMDKCEESKNFGQEIQQDLALDLENEVFTSLVNELVLDLTMMQVSLL